MKAIAAGSDDSLFDLDYAHQREGQRREQLLGDDLLKAVYRYDLLRERACQVALPSQVLSAWWQAYQKDGRAGLLPVGWEPLDQSSQEKVRERLAYLGALADKVEVTKEEILALTSTSERSDRTKMRLFQRYRVGGLWGLAPHYNPEKRRHPARKRPPKRAPGTLDEAAFAEIDKRYQILGDELMKQVRIRGHASRKTVQERAIEMGCSEKKIWNYLADYREHGLAGLAPKERSDKGKTHIVSPRMRNVIVGLLLPRRRRLSINKVHEEACKRAQALGEPEPSKWQVRRISASIRQPDKLLAEGRERDFKDDYGITYGLAYLDEGNPQIIFEIDHTQIDVLAKDLRSEKYRSKSGEIRPWLTLCIERRSRLVMAAIFGYDRPDQYTVAAAIREAILVSDDKPYGGVPDMILVDNGKELLSHHIQYITQGLHIMLKACIRHQPQQKGRVERTFGTLNTRLWSTLPGYVDSNTQKRNPHASAKLTIAQLEQKLREYITMYHNEVHSQLKGRTPLQYWQEHCFAEQKDERELDPLLMKKKTCKVIKTGIKYEKRLYWHRALADYVGKRVQVRSAPSYAPADDIEVYDEDIWICTAFATDSETGKAVTAEDVRGAQRDQREKARERIHEARDTVEQVDAEIVALQQQQKSNDSPPAAEAPQADSDGSPQQATQTLAEAPKKATNEEAGHAQTEERKDAHSHSPTLLDILRDHYRAEQ